MESKSKQASNCKNSLNTLVQNETDQNDNYRKKQSKIVNGNGTDLNNEKALRGRAKRKLITQKTVLCLIDVADKKGKPERKQGYWNAYHCQSRIYSSENKIYGTYCKNRICTLCNAIRKANILNRYLPEIQKWEEPYFLTLTIKAVPAKSLNKMISGIIRGFKIITTKYRKRYNRGKGNKLMGIKSLECNFNPVMKTYNPHLHLILPNKETADILTNEWLKLWTRKHTHRSAQFARKVNDIEHDLIEIIKYGSKIFTEPDMKKKSGKGVSAFIYASALDNILDAMKDHRIFDRFGFNLPKLQKQSITNTELLDYHEWGFDPLQADWINKESDDILTGYCLNSELISILNNNLDILIE